LLFSVAFAQTDCPTVANPADRRTDKTRLRIATFNAEWLFPGNDGYSPWTVPQADAHLIEVAKSVAQFNPDVLSLQEVQTCTMLQRLIDTLQSRHGLSGWKPYMIKGTDTATGQNVGFITRVDPSANVYRSENRYNYPVPGNTCSYTGSPGTSGVSKHYIAPFNIAGVATTMFGQHLLAFPTDPARCAQREAQASVMRGLINTAIANNQEIIVFGDWNDYSDAVKDSVNDVPISRVLKIERQGLVGVAANMTEVFNMTNVDPNLYEPSQLAPQAQRYTSFYDTNKVSMIDHIMVSTRISNAIISITFDHTYGETVSDHQPVYVDLKTPFP